MHHLVCIGLKEHEDEFGLSAFVREKFEGMANLSFIFLYRVTRGQAETVLLARDLVDRHKGLLIFNIDTMFTSKALGPALLRDDLDGVLGSFQSHDSRFSYASTDEGGFITRTAENEVISGHALTGLYHFRRPDDFERAARHMMENNLTVKGEFYIAPMYNYLIGRGGRYVLDHAEKHHILGTPEELDEFISNPM